MALPDEETLPVNLDVVTAATTVARARLSAEYVSGSDRARPRRSLALPVVGEVTTRGHASFG
jgi:hypothetical protein